MQIIQTIQYHLIRIIVWSFSVWSGIFFRHLKIYKLLLMTVNEQILYHSLDLFVFHRNDRTVVYRTMIFRLPITVTSDMLAVLRNTVSQGCLISFQPYHMFCR